jgi:hypothetical protein
MDLSKLAAIALLLQPEKLKKPKTQAKTQITPPPAPTH